MKIPYFYLEAGGIEIFQPQNKTKKSTGSSSQIDRHDGNGYQVLNAGYPDCTSRTLFVNGSDTAEGYKFLKPRGVTKLAPFLKLLRQHNEEN
jgi:hypothetical protein